MARVLTPPRRRLGRPIGRKEREEREGATRSAEHACHPNTVAHARTAAADRASRHPEDADVEQACRDAAAGEVVEAVNFNSPGQVVIAGQTAAVQRAIEAAERELDGNGRVVVRYSGTEALARVMVEAESEERMRALTAGIIVGTHPTSL